VAVELEALRLAEAGSGRPLVPVELEPAQRVDDEVDVLLGGARAVGVLDPHQKGAAVVARVEPVEERGPRAAHVQMTGGTGREAHANLTGHGANTARRVGPTPYPQRRGSVPGPRSGTRRDRGRRSRRTAPTP